MSDNGPLAAAEIKLIMVHSMSFGPAPSEVRIGTIRLHDWQVRRVTPLPVNHEPYDGYLIEAGYDLDIEREAEEPSWFEIGFAFGDAAVVDVMPRTVVDPQPPMSYVLNDNLHFIPDDLGGSPESVHLPAAAPIVDVFGVGGPEIRWRHTGGARPGPYTAWMMVLAPVGSKKLTVNATARYDISTQEALGRRPVTCPLRFDLDLTAGHDRVADVNPVVDTSRHTELVASGAPRVLITYAHDSPGHVQAVLRFAEFLCEHGIDTRLDRWDNDDRQDSNLWALDNVTKADFILVVASPRCKVAGEGQSDGTADRDLQSELSIVRDRLIDDRVAWLPKVLPVVLPKGSVDDIPQFLNARYVGYHPVVAFTRSGADSLLRAITKHLRYERPAVVARVVQRVSATPVSCRPGSS